MKTSTPPCDAIAPEAIVLHANYHQFSAGKRLRNPCVHSRMLLWCIRGKGRVAINGRDETDMPPGTFAVMPWQHSVEYRPASSDPFYVGGIHIVPRLDPGLPVVYHINHGRHSDPQSVPAEFAMHRDVPVPGLDAVLLGDMDDVPGLAHLATYTVEWFVAGEHDEFQARALARMLLSALSRYATSAPAPQLSSPPALERMQAYVRDRLDAPIRMDDLVRVGNCSTATINRLFHRHTGTSPMRWLMVLRMDQSARLLATTGLSVREIGVQVGIDDPQYFSKLFRRHHGMTALEYRRRTRLMP